MWFLATKEKIIGVVYSSPIPLMVLCKTLIKKKILIKFKVINNDFINRLETFGTTDIIIGIKSYKIPKKFVKIILKGKEND